MTEICCMFVREGWAFMILKDEEKGYIYFLDKMQPEPCFRFLRETHSWDNVPVREMITREDWRLYERFPIHNHIYEAYKPI